MSITHLRNATNWALVAALVLGAGATARAQEKDDGDVVQIGRADRDARPNVPPPGPQGDEERPAQPKFWIGLMAVSIPPDHPLRAHLDLPEKQGLIVVNVMPDSPAAKAGLKLHDILLKANDTDLHDIKDLIGLVMTEGPKKGQITLDVMRHNKHESINLKPEDRPADAEMQPGAVGGPDAGFGPGAANSSDPFAQQFGPQLRFQFRNMGPGVIVGGSGQGVASMPSGVSISIQKRNNEPTQITVSRGSEKWEIKGEDAEALKKLPDDLRPFVERMLHGGGGAAAFHMPGPGPGPGAVLGPGGPDGGPEGVGRGIRERMERMEQQLQEMQRRLHGDVDPATGKPDERGQDK